MFLVNLCGVSKLRLTLDRITFSATRKKQEAIFANENNLFLTLPPEILHIIFEFYLNSVHDDLINEQYKNRDITWSSNHTMYRLYHKWNYVPFAALIPVMHTCQRLRLFMESKMYRNMGRDAEYKKKLGGKPDIFDSDSDQDWSLGKILNNRYAHGQNLRSDVMEDNFHQYFLNYKKKLFNDRIARWVTFVWLNVEKCKGNQIHFVLPFGKDPNVYPCLRTIMACFPAKRVKPDTLEELSKFLTKAEGRIKLHIRQRCDVNVLVTYSLYNFDYYGLCNNTESYVIVSEEPRVKNSHTMLLKVLAMNAKRLANLKNLEIYINPMTYTYSRVLGVSPIISVLEELLEPLSKLERLVFSSPSSEYIYTRLMIPDTIKFLTIDISMLLPSYSDTRHIFYDNVTQLELYGDAAAAKLKRSKYKNIHIPFRNLHELKLTVMPPATKEIVHDFFGRLITQNPLLHKLLVNNELQDLVLDYISHLKNIKCLTLFTSENILMEQEPYHQLICPQTAISTLYQLPNLQTLRVSFNTDAFSIHRIVVALINDKWSSKLSRIEVAVAGKFYLPRWSPSRMFQLNLVDYMLVRRFRLDKFFVPVQCYHCSHTANTPCQEMTVVEIDKMRNFVKENITNKSLKNFIRETLRISEADNTDEMYFRDLEINGGILSE